MPAELNKLMDIIGYHFKKPELLKQAFTHSSYANECRINRICDYERLEFLGRCGAGDDHQSRLDPQISGQA